MAESVPKEEMEYEPGDDIIDISSFLPGPSGSGPSRATSMDIENAYELIENTILDPLYFDNEQALVSKLLDDDAKEKPSESAEEATAAATAEEEADLDIGKILDNASLGTVKESKAKKTVRKLPPALKGLMGEANLRYARGDKETAVKICLEIIRQVPTAPEPFQTLAGIYDEMGDQEKFLQMSLVAAHLTSTDVYQWTHLAEMSQHQGNVKQAIACYTRAINLNIENIELHKKRSALLERVGGKRTAVKGYLKLLSALGPEKGEYIIRLAKFIAEICHKENDAGRASAALDAAIKKVPQLVDLEFVNLHLELLIQLGQYRQCVEDMVTFCGLAVEAETAQDCLVITECSIPEGTPIDILAKLIVVLVHLRSFRPIPGLMEPISRLDIAETGDLYLDIVDAYMERERYEEAADLLAVLVETDNFGLPAVWLKYADSLKGLGRRREAVDAYRKVLAQAQHHNEAKMSLASILVELGRDDEAILALTQNETSETLDAGLLYERCSLLRRDPSRSKELIMVAQLLFLRHSKRIRNKDELKAISTIQRYDRKRLTVKQVRKCRKEPEGDMDIPEFKKGTNDPSVEDEWELFKHVCSLCIELRMYNVFQQIVFTAQLSTVFCVYKYEIDVLSVVAAYYNGDTYSGYNIVRTLVVKKPNNVKLWHLFNLIVMKSDDARHNRFIMRQLSASSNHPALGLLHGNNCLVSGTYKYAMHEYSTTYTKNPSPLCALLLGLTYLQMAAQKFTSKKHLLVMQALGLLDEYREKRGPRCCHEVHYNLGRGFHHLGLYSSAIYHYKRVLAPDDRPALSADNPALFDLSREAAFNLHLIYSQSESYDLAKMYLHKYIVV